MAQVSILRGDGSTVIADTEKRTLSYYRYHVRFTPLEWKILRALYEARPNVVEREKIIELIWGDEKCSLPTRTIDVHISSIRRKVSYIKGARIDSVYGHGYRLLMLTRF